MTTQNNLPSTSKKKQEESQKMEDPDECPIKQVEVTVPKTDDPTLPVVTFRMWVLGLAFCALLSFVNLFMWHRTNPMTMTSISAQIAVVSFVRFMA
ncbi:hypothetical protein Nepgr_010703 [Nepenthes gracilis]|uniref:Uncharacterized protein n=1 Tax=Nepenthes gracilis TaxID=150966 RepID=A0AAD3XLA4_NEPGR|nr:hypothetical protein Nepgr_010703 [Nepenthes gracilis]